MVTEASTKASLEQALSKWFDRECEGWSGEYGHIHPEVIEQMAEAAMLVLRVMRDASEYATQEKG